MRSLIATVRERDREPLPPLPQPDHIVIGSSAAATVRLPIGEVLPEHVRIEVRDSTAAIVTVGTCTVSTVDSRRELRGGETAQVLLPCTIELARYHLTFELSSEGLAPSNLSPQRTASLARELARNLLGESRQPSFTVLSGERAGTRRELMPPLARFTIGRGEDADWQIADYDLSRVHCAIERTWDGVRVIDLDSKNGTWVDGKDVGPSGIWIASGQQLRIGATTLQFEDHAERLVSGADAGAASDRVAAPLAKTKLAASEQEMPSSSQLPSLQAPDANPSSRLVFVAASLITLLAVVGIIYVWSV